MGPSGFHGALLGLTGSTVAVGAFFDAYRYRIPNVITVLGMLAGLFYHAGLGPDARGVVFSLLGLLPLLGAGFVLFALGWLGAGDAKLLGAVGALVGLRVGASVFLFAAAVGGVWALVWVMFESRGTALVYGVRGLRGRKVPYGVAIALGTGIALYHPLFGV